MYEIKHVGLQCLKVNKCKPVQTKKVLSLFLNAACTGVTDLRSAVTEAPAAYLDLLVGAFALHLMAA